VIGSRARGEAHSDFDYDIAVFLEDLDDRWREFHRLADLRSDILAETGVFLEARPFRAGSYRERTPLMHEIRRDGVERLHVVIPRPFAIQGKPHRSNSQKSRHRRRPVPMAAMDPGLRRDGRMVAGAKCSRATPRQP
jgi:uncharacterized protein